MKLFDSKRDTIELYTNPICPHTNQICNPCIFGTKEICNKCKDFDTNYQILLKNTYMYHENITDKNSTFNKIENKIEEDGGKYINIEGTIGFLIGATMTIEDFYWLYMDKDMNLHLSSCVGSYNVLNEVPEECNELDQIRQNNKEIIKKKIKDFLKNSKYDKAFTRLFH